MGSKRLYIRSLLLSIILLVGIILVHQWISASSTIDYSTQVKPIINKKCIGCHGGVKKNGGISFLFREELITAGESGRMAVVPGQPQQSEIIRRITHADPELRMPLEGDALSEEEVKILTQWVKEGAQWGEHWAYQPIKPPSSSEHSIATGKIDSRANPWIKNEIDAFVLAKLEQLLLAPNTEADCTTLVRRLSLDLIGLPPSPALVAQYCANPNEAQYQALIDTLLTNPAFGEHWSAHWLDLARYADTKGFERDPHREIWRYRDWLIQAFNRDLPYDQFTIEQLAGDLLPSPTPDQYTATAFHRNTMNNDEGGTNNEEYRIQAVIDRVNTTWAVWLGTTMNCVQCHSHPYDPIRHEDYYASFAFFNNSRDEDTPNESPRYRFYEGTDSLKLEEIKSFIQELNFPNIQQKEKSLERITQFVHTSEPKIHPHYFEFLENSAHTDTKNLHFYPNGLVKLPKFSIGQDSLLLISFNRSPAQGHLEIRADKKDGPLLGRIDLQSDYSRKKIFFTVDTYTDKRDLYFSYHPIGASPGGLSIAWMVFVEPPFPEFPQLQPKIEELLNTKGIQSIPIMLENQGKYQRSSQIFERGNWLVPGDTVQARVPDVFPKIPTNVVADRLAFAHWIVDPNNPLTARVAVNRFWEQIFGLGMVETSEDFGSQGSLPSHPDLLDYLAYEFMHTHQWSIKSLLRQILSSTSYRQSSSVSPLKLEKDPYNRYLSRGPRVRLSAEQVRDQTLAVSGLLSKKMHGSPVMPPQPDGVWSVVYNGAQWKPSTGEDRYRRALYTYWRRTSPYPSMISFDAPSREFCVIRRIRTNTPLQALVALNDPVYLEAAQALAESIVNKNLEVKNGIKTAFKRAIFRPPSAAELEELIKVYQEAHELYSIDTKAAKELLQAQDQLLFSSVDIASEHTDCIEDDCAAMAAMTVVSNVILNLDAFITKE